MYKRDNGKHILHRVLKVRRDDYVMCGDNRWAKEYGIQDRHIIGVLTAVIRNGKEINAVRIVTALARIAEKQFKQLSLQDL